MRVTLAEIQSYDPRGARAGGRNIRFLCGLSSHCTSHRSQAHRSLSVDLSTGFFFCHRCKSKGKLADVEFNQQEKVVRDLRKQVARDLDPSEKILKQMNFFRQSLAYYEKDVSEYIAKRRLSWSVIVKAKAGFCAEFKHFEKINEELGVKGTDRRLVFPIYDSKKRVVSYFARAIDEEWIDSPKMFRGDREKGVFFCEESDFDNPTVAICEGVFDALALKEANVSAIALNGTAVPDWLLFSLAKRRVIIATDSDATGEKLANDLVARLHPFQTVTTRLKFDTKDVAEILERDDLDTLKALVSTCLESF